MLATDILHLDRMTAHIIFVVGHCRDGSLVVSVVSGGGGNESQSQGGAGDVQGARSSKSALRKWRWRAAGCRVVRAI